MNLDGTETSKGWNIPIHSQWYELHTLYFTWFAISKENFKMQCIRTADTSDIPCKSPWFLSFRHTINVYRQKCLLLLMNYESSYLTACFVIFSCPYFCLRQLYTYPCHLLTDWLTHRGFTFWHQRDLWPLRHFIRVVRRHDLTKKILNLKKKLAFCNLFWYFFSLVLFLNFFRTFF